MIFKAVLTKPAARPSRAPLIWGLLAVLLLGGIALSMTAGRHTAMTCGLLTEKGAALIGALEGGVRLGKRTPAGVRLQLFLEELVTRDEVRFFALTMPDGTIVAHSDPKRLGEILATEGREMTPEEIAALHPGSDPAWVFTDMEGGPAFVVYRVFHPRGGEARPRSENGELEPYVFVGLNPAALVQARQRDARMAQFIGWSTAFGCLLVFGVWHAVQRFRASRRGQRVAEALAEVLTVSVPDGLLFFDHQGRIVRMNAVALRLTGLADTPQGKAEEALPAPLAELATRLFSGAGPVEEEIRLERQGRLLHIGVRGGHIADAQEGRIGSLLLLRDLTEVRRLEAEVRRREKLAAVGNLAAGVAHELRNPLSSIKGYATYFSGRFPEGSEEREAALVMVREADRLNRAITDLIGLSRPMALRGQPTALAKLVEDALRLVRQEAETRGIAIRLECADTPPIVVDPDRIRQVLLNLCLNAFDAMPQGGALTLRLSAEASPTGAPEHLVLEVADTGCGIPQDQLPHIFDPYFTTKGHGTGLGLVMVHKILEAHGGSIAVTSTPGQGTVFRILLPVRGVNHQGDNHDPFEHTHR